MELRHLNYFVAVASSGGFARAARLLHVSQSAISEQVRDLESELGAVLLDRRGRQLKLTAQGEIFLVEARQVLRAAERAVQAVQQSLRGDAGHLRIGFFVGGNGSFFPARIRAFRARHPDVVVSLVEMTPVRQVEALLRGDIDVAFTRPLPLHLANRLAHRHIHTERLYAVLPQEHPAAAQREICLAALAKEPFVMLERSSSMVVFDKIVALCNAAKFSPEIAATASVSSGILALVEAGQGVAIVPEGSIPLGSDAVRFVRLADEGASVALVMAWSPERVNPVVQSFLASANASGA